MDWWPFLTLRTRIGYGSLHSEHQNRSSNLRWWIRKCTALCSRPLNMLRSYILLFAVWCPLNLYALCSDMFSLLWLLRFAFQAWITIPQSVCTRWISDRGSSCNDHRQRHWPSCNEEPSHIDWTIVWRTFMTSLRCVNSLHTRWYVICHCSCLFVERIPGCWLIRKIGGYPNH